MEDIRIGGLSADEWEALANPQQTTTDDLTNLGIIQGQESQEPPQNSPKAEREDYEKLGYFQTIGDEITASAAEASKFFIPKKYELNYTPRTKAGEAAKTFTKYLLGISGLFAGGEGAAIAKGVAAAKGMTGAAKVAGGLEAVLKGNKFFKGASLGTKALNIGTQGVLQGAIIDATIHDVDEGRIVDLFGETQNKFIDWLQTDENDSTAVGKLKNVIDGAIFSIGINGVFSVAEPIIGRVLNTIKAFKNNKVAAEEVAQKTTEIIQDQTKLAKIAETADIVNTVKELKETSEDASEAIINTFHPDNIEDAQNILKMLEAGDDIVVHEDGTFAIKVSKWDDAYKVSPEEYKRQLAEADQLKANTSGFANAGDTALEHQEAAVQHTWINRGWIGENEKLTQKAANKIAKNYKDKFKIDNNIKVEFVDGLTIKGKAVEGNTSATTFLGKKSKKGTKPNITIQIDKEAQNPFATLRAEIEHARDIAKEEVPNQSERHFARYNGLNEGEVASEYTYKKSVGKNNALKNFMNDGQATENSVKYNQGDKLNGQQGNSTAKSREQKAEATRRFVEGAAGNNNSGSYENGLFVQRDNLWVVNESKGHLFGDANVSKASYKQLPQTTESGQQFADALSNAKKNLGAEGENVDVHIAEDYANSKTFLSEDGLSGVAVTQDGEIISVFVDPTAKVADGRGRGRALVELAKQNGGTHLNCYDVGLPEYYKSHGFTETSRMKWNDKFWDKEKWHKELHTKYNNGEPDVVEMALDKPKPQTEQLKLDFNAATTSAKTTEELVENVTSGSAKISDVEDVGTILNKTLDLDAEISGTTWEAIAKDADKMADVMLAAEELGLNKELAEALSMNDVNTMDEITRKVLAAQKLKSSVADKLALLGKNPPIEQMKAVIDTIDIISRYTKETGSASGRNLQARKFINKAVETFGSLRLSQLTKEGINTVSDLLSVKINKLIDLNFTKGAALIPQQMKQQLMEDLLQNTDSPFIQLLAEDAELAAKFDNILDDLFKGGKVTPENVYSKLEEAITEARYKEVFNATQLAENSEAKANVISKWCDAQGGLTSFYVHNLLSGVGTLAKNVISGGLNTLYFPAKKIVAGYLGGGSALAKEGWNTYRNLLSSGKEAWSLGKQAFLNGEGQLLMMKDTMSLADEEVFNGFREWHFDFSTKEGWRDAIQNFHSMMTRAMGASDEFMSQLNYRAIKRAKALEQAEKLAEQYGIFDEKIKANMADKIFKNAFNKAGKPLDVEALAEAKDILYQLPLNGQVFDNSIGEMVQVRPQTWVTRTAGGLNSEAAKIAPLKFLFPFIKTGANILQQNLEHNGIYAVLSNSQRQLLKANTKEGALARSQVAFGMFSFMLATGLAISGAITGSAPTDPKERKALFETGWKPYSVRIGDKFISYQGYEPIQTILGFAADSVNIYGNIVNSDDEAKWKKFSQQVLATSVNNFLDKAAFRTGLRQLAFMTSPEENWEEFIKTLQSTAQGFLPDSSMVRSVSSLGNRSITTPTGYERIFNNYFNRGLGDYRRDVFGNRQDNFGLLVTNITPDNASQPEYEEMEYLAQFGFSPSEISETIKETSLKYTDFTNSQTGRSVYDTMQEELSTIEINGKTLQEAVRELVTSQEYQDLPLGVNMNGYKYLSSEATKLNAIRSIFVEYNNAALQNVIKEYGDIYLDKKGRTMSEAIEEVNNEKLNQSINEGLEHNIGNQIKRFGQ